MLVFGVEVVEFLLHLEDFAVLGFGLLGGGGWGWGGFGGLELFLQVQGFVDYLLHLLVY